MRERESEISAKREISSNFARTMNNNSGVIHLSNNSRRPYGATANTSQGLSIKSNDSLSLSLSSLRVYLQTAGHTVPQSRTREIKPPLLKRPVIIHCPTTLFPLPIKDRKFTETHSFSPPMHLRNQSYIRATAGTIDHPESIN